MYNHAHIHIHTCIYTYVHFTVSNSLVRSAVYPLENFFKHFTFLITFLVLQSEKIFFLRNIFPFPKKAIIAVVDWNPQDQHYEIFFVCFLASCYRRNIIVTWCWKLWKKDKSRVDDIMFWERKSILNPNGLFSTWGTSVFKSRDVVELKADFSGFCKLEFHFINRLFAFLAILP